MKVKKGPMGLEFLLKSFADEDKPEVKEQDGVSLSGILQRKRLKLGREKGSRVAGLSFSPYNVGYGFCMREKVTQLAGYHQILIKPPTPKEQLIFDVGKRYHDIIQGYFWKLGMLEGTWRCRECWYTWWDISPKVCAKCGSKYNLEFREVPLKDEDYSISGRADGIILVEHNNTVEKHLLDIKSISNRGRQDNPLDPRVYYEDLDEQGASVTHRVQLGLYMKMSGISDGHLLYVGKNGHQMKSFHIRHNEALLEPYLKTIQEALVWAKELKEEERYDLPPVCDRKKCECEKIIRKGGNDGT